MHPSKIYRLSQYEEGAGVLHELIEKDDILVAHIGKIHFVLPLDMEESLRPLIGQKITILHTNIPDNLYLFRVLAKDREVNPNELESGLAVEENEKRRCLPRHRCHGGYDVE